MGIDGNLVRTDGAPADQIQQQKYAAMQGMHQKMYPDRIAAEIDLYHGTHINARDFVKVADCVGCYGEQVTDPEKLQDALKRGLEATRRGKPAIIDVIVT